MAFFARRVDKIRAATPDVADMAPALLSSFQMCNEADICCIIMSSPVKSCFLASLSQGRLPDSQKHAIILPHLKKSSQACFQQTWLISSSIENALSVKSDKVVDSQLNVYLIKHGLLPCYQSAYRHHHLTETAMLCGLWLPQSSSGHIGKAAPVARSMYRSVLKWLRHLVTSVFGHFGLF